jgi:hypothetical protein
MLLYTNVSTSNLKPDPLSRSSLHEQWRVGQSTKEILKLLDRNLELKQMVVRNLRTGSMLQFLVTGSISTFMIFHLPTQMYVLTHGWPLVLSWALTIGLLVLLRCTPYNVSSLLHYIKRKLISSFTEQVPTLLVFTRS